MSRETEKSSRLMFTEYGQVEVPLRNHDHMNTPTPWDSVDLYRAARDDLRLKGLQPSTSAFETTDNLREARLRVLSFGTAGRLIIKLSQEVQSETE